MEALDIIFHFWVLTYSKRQSSRDIRPKSIKSLCLKTLCRSYTIHLRVNALYVIDKICDKILIQP